MLFRSAQQKGNVGKDGAALRLRGFVGSVLFRGHGRMDGAVRGGRSILAYEVAGGAGGFAADNGSVLCFQRSFSAGSAQAARQKARQAQNQIRGVWRFIT